MLDENLEVAPALETEPAPEIPVTGESTDAAPEPEKGTEPAAEADKSTEAPEATDEPIAEDDPFAEFETSATKDESYYDRLFKTEKWKHVPHTARDEIRSLVKANEAVLSGIDAIGGQPMLDTFKPVSAAILNPDPTPEEVDAAFDAIDTHNPKVIQQLGATFTKNWVQEVVKDPVQNLSPLMQHTFAQALGKDASAYDLNRVLEFIQLDMARDAEGEPILDLESARYIFQQNGGVSAFKHQQELAEYKRQISELQNGYKPAAPAQTPQAEPDITGELEKEILPNFEAIVSKAGYKPGDAEYSLLMDAVKFRLHNSPETRNIKTFAKNGPYKTADGKYVQGVENNKKYLIGRLRNQFLTEIKAFHLSRKGVTAANLEQPKVPAPIKQPETQQSPPPQRDPKKPLTLDEIIDQVSSNAKNRARDERSAQALAAGK
jgi:hypothetical protein